MRNCLALILLLLASATALADVPLVERVEIGKGFSGDPPYEPEPNEKANDAKVEQPSKRGTGMCMGLPTRCGLLPKGVCFMQAGCYNPTMGDRCGGSAKQCTQFYTKSACYTQRGCIWAK